jgi:hypothetical protein
MIIEIAVSAARMLLDASEERHVRSSARSALFSAHLLRANSRRKRFSVVQHPKNRHVNYEKNWYAFTIRQCLSIAANGHEGCVAKRR